MCNVRVLIPILVFTLCAGNAEAQWAGATYDTPYTGVYCLSACPGSSGVRGAGTAIDLSNAYIGVAAVDPFSLSPTGTGTSVYSGSLSLSQFASAKSVASLQNLLMTQGATLSSLQGMVTSQGQSILNLQMQNAAFASQMASVTQELGLISNQVADLIDAQRATEKHAWIGSALASALVTISPAEGKTNRLGMNMATVQGQSAVGLNYVHVSGGWDLNAGVAVSTSHSKYVEGRVGLGFSW